MKNQRIPVIINLGLALIVVLVLLPRVTRAGDEAALNEQLMEAASNGDLVRLKALLSKGADVNARDQIGSTPLIVASFRGKTDVVKLLLEKGADSEARGLLSPGLVKSLGAGLLS